MSKISSLLKKWSETSLVLRILGGLIIGAVLGLLFPQWTGIGILGKVFVSALKAIAPILVALLVAASIAKAKGGLGARFRTVITLYLVSTFCAALFAVVASFLFPIAIRLQGAEAEGAVPGGLADVFLTLLTNMVMNPVQALAQANYIGILFWAIIVGLALKLVASENTVRVVSDLADVVSQVVRWVIQFAPFGILGLVFSSVSESGLEIFTDYGRLLLLLVGCMCCTAFIVNPFIAWLHTPPEPLSALLAVPERKRHQRLLHPVRPRRTSPSTWTFASGSAWTRSSIA
jgi:Na+/serine symporter